MDEQKASKYIVGIVAVVGAVALLLLLSGSFDFSNDISGQAIKAKSKSLDKDKDGMLDAWEKKYGLDPTTDDSADDTDSDGLTNLEEFTAKTNPTDADTDGDELTDYEERLVYQTDPLQGDGDADSLEDSVEIVAGTDPRNADTDGDGLADGEEVNTYITNPTDADTDDDEYSDGAEVEAGTDPLDSSSYPEPDLVADEATTSFGLEGTVYTHDGTVVGQEIEVTLVCVIKNQGTADAIGSRSSDPAIYSKCVFYDDKGSTYSYTGPSLTFTTPIVPGVLAINSKTSSYSGSSHDVSLLQEIYDGAADVYVVYDVDYATTSNVEESDETNNQDEFTITLDSTMYNLKWEEVECGSDDDCASGYWCDNYACAAGSRPEEENIVESLEEKGYG